jgi:hypothetical protein
LADILLAGKEREAKLLIYMLCNAASPVLIDGADRISRLESQYSIESAFHSNLIRKVAFRNLPDSYVEEGNHYCDFNKIEAHQVMIGCELGLSLKHYPVRSIAQLRKKIANGKRALAEYTGPKYVGSHWRSDAREYEASGDGFLREKMMKYIASVRAAANRTDREAVGGLSQTRPATSVEIDEGPTRYPPPG